MKSLFSRSFVLSVLVCTFVFGAFVSATEVKAQSTSSIYSTIEALIAAGVIAPDKANAARAAGNCLIPVTPIPVVPVVEYVSQTTDITTSDDGLDFIHGTFKFKVTAQGGDVQIMKNSIDLSLVNLEKSGVIVGKPQVLSLVSTTNDVPADKVFHISEGTTDTFILSYHSSAYQGPGYYRGRMIYLPYIGGSVVVDGPENPFVSGYVFLNSTAVPAGNLQVAVTDAPTNSLSYSVGGQITEAYLNGKLGLTLDAEGGDVYVYTKTTAVFADDSGHIKYVEAEVVNTSPAEIVTIPDSMYSAIKVLEGKSVKVVISAKADTSTMFAGSYTFEVPTIAYAPDLSIKNEKKYFLKAGTSNRVLIVGETSPYLNSATYIPQITPGFAGVKVGGVRLNSSQKAYINCSGEIENKNYKSTNTESSFVIFDNLKPGTKCAIQVTDPKTGGSNVYGFTVGGFPVTPSSPTLKFEQKAIGSSDFSSETAVLPVGAELLFHWEGVNASNCIASANPKVSTWNGAVPDTGLISVGKVDVSRTYYLKCQNGKEVVEKKINVLVEGKPVPTTPSITNAEIFCSKGDWVGKNSVIGMWFKKDLKYNPDQRFLCHTDTNIYRCTTDGDEAGNTSYWNTFSTRINNGAPTPNYTCSVSAGKWVKNQPSVTVLSPNGGELYKTGTTINIKWKSNLPIADVSYSITALLVPKCGPGSACVTAPTIVANNVLGTDYKWLLPKNLVDGGEMKISVCTEGKNVVCDTSDSSFTVVSAVVPPVVVTPVASTTTVTAPVASTTSTVKPFDTSITNAEIFCNKGEWYGKNSVIGMWLKKDLKYNPDQRFLCHTDTNIYRCTTDGDEAGNTSYWNTFSTRINNGAPTPNYTCSVSAGKWVKR